MILRAIFALALSPLSFPALADGLGAALIEVPGTTFPAIVAGQGMPVVFVHGMLADHRAWSGLADATVAHGYRFIAYTQRGFGPGSSADDPFSRDQHIDDLLAILKVIDTPADLVAWSYGGAVALAAAAKAPDRVRRVVLYEPYLPELAPEADESIGQSMGATVAAMDAGDINSAAETAVEALLGIGDGGFETESTETQSIQRDNAASFAAAWNSATPTAITCDELETIKAPVLIVIGGTTLPGFADMSKAVAACIPGSQTVTMDGQGHGAPLFGRDDFGKLAFEFIGKS